jgi:tetratricopeptide (TPR) repeat protein
MESMKWIFLVILSLLFSSCQKLEDLSRESWKNRGIANPNAGEEDIEKWKERLDLKEAEVKEIQKSMIQYINSSKELGGLYWKMGHAYMRLGNAESAIHHYETAIQFMEKSLGARKVDKEVLFEMGLAYANASKDRGWNPQYRSKAIDVFRGLMRLDPEDHRFPYQLALIYFDSGMSEEAWGGVVKEGYEDPKIAFKFLDAILLKEPINVPVRFAKANFLYRLGKVDEAKTEYLRIQNVMQTMHKDGKIQGDLESNPSYQNLIRNLKQIETKP